ncbi:unnamed protein product [Ectocarpus sp. 12 AP-2014]
MPASGMWKIPCIISISGSPSSHDSRNASTHRFFLHCGCVRMDLLLQYSRHPHYAMYHYLATWCLRTGETPSPSIVDPTDRKVGVKRRVRVRSGSFRDDVPT